MREELPRRPRCPLIILALIVATLVLAPPLAHAAAFGCRQTSSGSGTTAASGNSACGAVFASPSGAGALLPTSACAPCAAAKPCSCPPANCLSVVSACREAGSGLVSVKIGFGGCKFVRPGASQPAILEAGGRSTTSSEDVGNFNKTTTTSSSGKLSDSSNDTISKASNSSINASDSKAATNSSSKAADITTNSSSTNSTKAATNTTSKAGSNSKAATNTNATTNSSSTSKAPASTTKAPVGTTKAPASASKAPPVSSGGPPDTRIEWVAFQGVDARAGAHRDHAWLRGSENAFPEATGCLNMEAGVKSSCCLQLNVQGNGQISTFKLACATQSVIWMADPTFSSCNTAKTLPAYLLTQPGAGPAACGAAGALTAAPGRVCGPYTLPKLDCARLPRC